MDAHYKHSMIVILYLASLVSSAYLIRYQCRLWCCFPVLLDCLQVIYGRILLVTNSSKQADTHMHAEHVCSKAGLPESVPSVPDQTPNKQQRFVAC